MWLISLTLLTLIISLWITWRRRQFTLFQKLNIPGPEPNILFGNYWEILHKGQHNCIKKWVKEYGRIFGYYYGMRPVLIVADLDLLKTIQLKEFHKFSNRPRLFEVGSASRKFNEHSIASLEGKRWKELRSVITPTFTTSKLKMMSYILTGAIDELLEALDNKASKGKPFDIYPLYQNLTMDVIARTALGLHSTAQKGTNDIFVKLARIILSINLSFLTLLTFSFTELVYIFSILKNLRYYIKNDGTHPREDLANKVHAAIQARRKDPSTRRPDVLQLMIDAQRPGKIVNDTSLTAGENDETISDGSMAQVTKLNEKALTDDEIEHNGVVFLLAGYDTTSTALAFLTYCLASHQDVQDKVREEINEHIQNEEIITYEAVYKLPYMDKVINEALRMYPPIKYFVNRKATEDITVDGHFIPKDLAIQVPVFYLHHDPTIWEHPETFDPERFSPEEKRNRHPMAFQAFGAGPRNCVGMRFAQMEIKMAIAKIIKKYKILPKKGSRKEDFATEHTIITLRPKDGVLIELEEL